MDRDAFGILEDYAGLEDLEIYDDFESIVSDAVDAAEEGRSFTSSQLPDGFVSETLDGKDFGFLAEKEYDEGSVEVEYRESTDIGFGATDSSRMTVSVEPLDYSFREAWDHQR